MISFVLSAFSVECLGFGGERRVVFDSSLSQLFYTGKVTELERNGRECSRVMTARMLEPDPPVRCRLVL